MDFFSRYLEAMDLENQEAPAIYHRWALASIIGALLGRQCHLPFGKYVFYPNQFIMLMGTPGARKGAAMGPAKDILKAAGYTRFSASRTSLERFLMDMRQMDVTPELDLEALALDTPSESYIYAGEFVDFIGPNDINFINLLTNLWDNLPEYKHPKIQGKSVEVYRPTVNLLGGATPQTFAMAFPPEVIGTGFTSRLLMIHSEPTGRKISWPTDIDPLVNEQLVLHLKEIREVVRGEIVVTPEARELSDVIYKNEVPVDDNRFTFYQQRRYTHMLKLSMIIAAANLSKVIQTEHVLWANTMLAMAEKKMPKALGEFGKSRHSEVSNEILTWLNRRTKPANVGDIFKAVSRSVKNLPELQEVIANLKAAEKIQTVTVAGKTGYMPRHEAPPEWKSSLLDLNWLTAEEKI